MVHSSRGPYSPRGAQATALETVTPYKRLLGELEQTRSRLRDTMQAMSTPLIPISERIVVMPRAQIVLTGIRPAVAQTLVDLGLDLAGLMTKGRLQSAIAFASQRGRAAARPARA